MRQCRLCGADLFEGETCGHCQNSPVSDVDASDIEEAVIRGEGPIDGHTIDYVEGDFEDDDEDEDED